MVCIYCACSAFVANTFHYSCRRPYSKWEGNAFPHTPLRIVHPTVLYLATPVRADENASVNKLHSGCVFVFQTSTSVL